MMQGTYWLPDDADWKLKIRAAERTEALCWHDVVGLANARLDFLQTERLATLIARKFSTPPEQAVGVPVRLAVLGSSTTTHLLAGIRVAAARRGLWLDLFEGGYGQYVQPLLGRDAQLEAFAPSVLLLVLDARHLSADVPMTASAEEVDERIADKLATLQSCWAAAQSRLGATVIQQMPLPVLPDLMGSQEERMPGAPAAVLNRMTQALKACAAPAGVHLIAVDRVAAREGMRRWHDPALWHRAKQEVSPLAAPLYGDLVARLLAALQGRSAKCLVLDLDNTLWGGVVGDDGVNGIVLGQGSAAGEAFADVQRHARALAARGVILAVCSKNDEENALAAFDRHPEMLLRRGDIAAFVANWDDKATNLRRIADMLNIGLDALVFVDDNPFERNLVRGELPQVMVPELPDDDPAAIPQTLSDAGYFEALAITRDDVNRNAFYAADVKRQRFQREATDLSAYLRDLNMRLAWKPYDSIDLPRVTQLLNKTNQFNLVTRRLAPADVQAIVEDEASFGLQFRLEDRFGANGVIAVVNGHVDAVGDGWIDDWVMSCRVFGRGVERATLGVVVEQLRQRGARRLIGRYVDSGRNAMTRSLLDDLGFRAVPDLSGGWLGLELDAVPRQDHWLSVVEDDDVA